MRTRRGLGPRHTAPMHRQAATQANDSTAREPIRVGRNGAYELAFDETLEVDSDGCLRVVQSGIPSADSLAGPGLQEQNGALRVSLSITKGGTVASGAYVQAELQAVSDKLDELIGLVQDDTSRRT